MKPLQMLRLRWPPTAFLQRHFIAFGCFLQAEVFLLDLTTPPGFAHGVLYAPAVFFGLAAHRNAVIGLLTGLGLLGTVMGYFFSAQALPYVTQTYILLNRGLGVLIVLLSGVVCVVLLRLLRRLLASERRRSLSEIWNAVAIDDPALLMLLWAAEPNGKASYSKSIRARMNGRSAGEASSSAALRRPLLRRTAELAARKARH